VSPPLTWSPIAKIPLLGPVVEVGGDTLPFRLVKLVVSVADGVVARARSWTEAGTIWADKLMALTGRPKLPTPRS
jgi:hypothetical protein